METFRNRWVHEKQYFTTLRWVISVENSSHKERIQKHDKGVTEQFGKIELEKRNIVEHKQPDQRIAKKKDLQLKKYRFYHS